MDREDALAASVGLPCQPGVGQALLPRGAASARAGWYDAGQGRGLLRGRAHSGDPPGRRAQRSAQPRRAAEVPGAAGGGTAGTARDLTRSVVAGERAGSGGAGCCAARRGARHGLLADLAGLQHDDPPGQNEQNPQSARRNNFPGEQISRRFLLLSENLSASNYPAAALTPQQPTQRQRFGELPEGLSGSTLERGRRGEKRQELGRASWCLGCEPQGGLAARGAEDHAGGRSAQSTRSRESRAQGEGADRNTQPAQETLPEHEGADSQCPPPCRD
jgi:hypothetical protein